MSPRDCKHGLLRRACETCDLEEEVVELRRRVVRLEDAAPGGEAEPKVREKPPYDIALRPDVDSEDPFSIDTLQDDIVVNDVVMFRAEQMGPDDWWVCCFLRDDKRLTFNVTAKCRPRRIEWTVTELPDESDGAGFIYEHELGA